MPERASVFERPLISVETTSGTPASTGYKQLQSMSFSPSVKANVNTFRPQGSKFPSVAALGKEWTETKLSGQPTFTEIIYPLSSVLGAATITTVGSSTKKWVWSPNNSSADTPSTFTIEQGSNNVRVGQYAYSILSDFGMKLDRNTFGMDGTLLAQRYRDDKTRWLSISGTPAGGTFTITVGANTTSGIAYSASAATVQTAVTGLASVGTGNATCYGGPLPGSPILIVFKGTMNDAELPTISTTDSLTGGSTPASSVTRLNGSASTLALVPIIPPQFAIKMADTQAGLAGATALTRVLNEDWSLGSRFGPIWSLDSSQESWAAHVETVPKSSFSLKLAADSNGMPLLVNLRKGTTKFFEVKAVGDATESGQTYLYQLQVAVKINQISDFSDADGLFAVQFGGEMTYDSTWTKTLEVTVQNLITAL